MRTYNRRELVKASDLNTETETDSLAATALSLDCLLATLHPAANASETEYKETLTTCKELLECESAYETLAELEDTDSDYRVILDWVNEALAAVYC